MSKKVRINVTIDEDLYYFAKDIGLNISRFLNNRLRDLRDKLQSDNLPPEDEDKSNQCGGRDLNPRTPTGRDLESLAFGLARQPPL